MHLDKKDIPLLSWPGNKMDFPIENVWNVLKSMANEWKNPNNQTLFWNISQIWQGVEETKTYIVASFDIL